MGGNRGRAPIDPVDPVLFQERLLEVFPERTEHHQPSPMRRFGDLVNYSPNACRNWLQGKRGIPTWALVLLDTLIENSRLRRRVAELEAERPPAELLLEDLKVIRARLGFLSAGIDDALENGRR